MYGSVCMQKNRKVYLKTKDAVLFVFNKDKLTHSKPSFENLNAFNVYQIHIYQHLNFKHEFINNQIPSIFPDFIKRPGHKYPTNFSKSSFCLSILWIVENILFPSVDLNYGMMLLIKKRKIFNFIRSLKRKLNHN